MKIANSTWRVHYPKEALQKVACAEAKSQLLEEQKLQLRWLLPSSLLLKGFFNEKQFALDGCKKDKSSQMSGYSWSGHRKAPSYFEHLVFPEDLLAALRTIAMQEDELHHVISLLQEVQKLLQRNEKIKRTGAGEVGENAEGEIWSRDLGTKEIKKKKRSIRCRK
eukprot:Gb_11486 [translate_table: standard]